MKEVFLHSASGMIKLPKIDALFKKKTKIHVLFMDSTTCLYILYIIFIQ